LFEAAYREVVLENNKAEWPAFRSPLEGDAEAEAEGGKQEGEGDKAPETGEEEAKVEGAEEGKVQVNKDDIALIVSHYSGERAAVGEPG
jgi:NACalpha-BTF3-like transcription factor